MSQSIQTRSWLARNAVQSALAEAVKRMEHEIEVTSSLIAGGKHDLITAVPYFREKLAEAKAAADELRAIRVVLKGTAK